MAKLTLSDLANLSNENSAVTTINNNSNAIETAIENTLSRDGTSPNSMGADLDLNSNDILNVASLEATTIEAGTVEADNFTVDGVSLNILLIDWEGQWLTATSYLVGDVVYNLGSSYIATVAHTSAALTQPGVGANWEDNWDLIVQKGDTGEQGIPGEVQGPASSTDNAIARFDGTTGELIQNSSVTVDDSGGLILAGQASPTHTAGKLVYDTGSESITFYNNESDVALQVGQEMWIRVRNSSGSTITNGSAVYVNGNHAGSELPTIALARSNAESTSICVGLTTHDIENNSTGYVTAKGVVHSINTSSFSNGDRLYVSSAVAGALTATIPSAPNFRVRVGVVTKAAANGSIFVDPLNALAGFGTGNQIAGMNNGATAIEYKTLSGTANQITVTHAANSITLATPQNIGTGSSPQFSTIELGAASDTTLSRSAAGRLAVEGVDVVTTSSTDTLTNKTLTNPSLGASYMELAEIASPSNPAANILRMFAKDSAGVTKLFTRDSAGTETELGAGGGGGITSVALQAFTSSGTYTPTAGMDYCIVFSTGGGGGGGGCDSDGSSNGAAGGGGSGATCIELFDAATIGASQTVTIGAGGTAGAVTGGNGGAGGDTTFGALHTAGGGPGGIGLNATATENAVAGVAGGTASGGLLNIPGGMGHSAVGGNDFVISGPGGSSFWGGGARAVSLATAASTAGVTATAYGAGGSGAANISQTAGVLGGVGAPGVCFVIEFIS